MVDGGGTGFDRSSCKLERLFKLLKSDIISAIREEFRLLMSRNGGGNGKRKVEGEGDVRWVVYKILEGVCFV